MPYGVEGAPFISEIPDLMGSRIYLQFVASRGPRLCVDGIAGFETSSRPYILKYGAPCHPADAIVR